LLRIWPKISGMLEGAVSRFAMSAFRQFSPRFLSGNVKRERCVVLFRDRAGAHARRPLSVTTAVFETGGDLRASVSRWIPADTPRG